MQKNSMIDFPGKISCVLFLSGCNFNCPYCHNPSLVKPDANHPPRISAEQALNFLKERRLFLDGVVISGGEPTLQPGLADFCRQLKAIGYPLKLDTNGSRPEVIQALLRERLLDYIAMDLKTDLAQYPALIQNHATPAQIADSIRIIMASGVAYEFKTTCVKPFVTESALRHIAPLISGARLYILQTLRTTTVLNPDFFRHGEPLYQDQDLQQFKTMMTPWVQQCAVR